MKKTKPSKPKEKKNKTVNSYTEKYGKSLNKVVNNYRKFIDWGNMFSTNEFAIFNTIKNGITLHPLRYYQEEALFVLDYIYSHSQSELRLKQTSPIPHKIKDFVKDLLDKIEDDKLAPFIGFEMATGSGKTMLMGASTYFLNKKYGINNFLIITPASTDIYQKTIRNFNIGNYESVWADDTPFTFNLITGDDYTQDLLFDNSKDANIFIFNISKFGANATNTKDVWESAIWKDEKGNSVSIRKFLEDQKLVIITDEAHHSQTRTANTIIKTFHPLAVLEFTATAIEDSSNENKKNQNIVYKYNIRNFLEDGHGKLVKAVALVNQESQRRGQFNENEKLKLITLLLIHLLKKEAVLLDPKCKGLKPLAFVKVKEDTTYTEKVFKYLKDELVNDTKNIKIILEKIKNQDLEITDLLEELYNGKYKGKLDLLKKDIQKVVQTAIFYYGKSDKETEKKFLNIRRNEVEIVVYMHRLDEGIDLPNIYTMAVINDNTSDFKTSVKQIIGRGVRLNKDTREFDDDLNLMRANSEKLHIVCDQGKNFEDVILSIQQEFGLNDKYLSIDKEKKTISNKAKSELLDGKYIPHIKADFRVRESVKLLELISDVDSIINNYIEDNCFEGKEDTIKRFLKYKPESFFLEVDVFSDKNEYHEQIIKSNGIETTLNILDTEINSIYGIVLKNLHCLPNTEYSKNIFKLYADKLNKLSLKYYRINSADDKLASNLFVESFSFFYRNHIEKNYFSLDFRQLHEEDSWNLKAKFRDYEFKIPVDQIERNAYLRVIDKKRLIDLVGEQYNFKGYKNSIYEYNSFDSYIEFTLARYLDEILGIDKSDLGIGVKELEIAADEPVHNKANETFWVRNQRNVYFSYGVKKYYPDFILFMNGIIYVIEVKGEKFSDAKKNRLIENLNEIKGDNSIKGYKGLIIFSRQAETADYKTMGFAEFVAEAERIYRTQQTKIELINDPPENEKYFKYLPVYSPEKALKKFIKEQKSPKPEGWIDFGSNKDGYPETCFVTQVKGSSLSPIHENNSWMIFDSSSEMKNVKDKICLVYHKKIEDDHYADGFTIRKVNVEESEKKGSLFTEKKIILSGLNEHEPVIILDNVINESEFVVVGVNRT